MDGRQITENKSPASYAIRVKLQKETVNQISMALIVSTCGIHIQQYMLNFRLVKGFFVHCLLRYGDLLK